MNTAAVKLALTSLAFVTAATSTHAGGPAAAVAEPELAAPAAALASNSIWSGFWIGASMGSGSSAYDIGAHITDVDTGDRGGLGRSNLRRSRKRAETGQARAHRTHETS